MDADGHGFGRDKRLNRKDAEVAEKTEDGKTQEAREERWRAVHWRRGI